MYDLVGDELVGDEVEDILSGDDDDGIGYDLEDIVGAAVAQATGRAPNRAAMAARIAERGASVVRKRKATKSRKYVLSLDSSSTIAAAASSNVQNQPQVLFRPERLMIDATLAASFLVNSFVIGKNSQFAASGSVPASMFAQTAVGGTLKLDTAQVSALVVLNVTNTSAGALRFTAGLIGQAIE